MKYLEGEGLKILTQKIKSKCYTLEDNNYEVVTINQLTGNLILEPNKLYILSDSITSGGIIPLLQNMMFSYDESGSTNSKWDKCPYWTLFFKSHEDVDINDFEENINVNGKKFCYKNNQLDDISITQFTSGNYYKIEVIKNNIIVTEYGDGDPIDFDVILTPIVNFSHKANAYTTIDDGYYTPEEYLNRLNNDSIDGYEGNHVRQYALGLQNPLNWDTLVQTDNMGTITIPAGDTNIVRYGGYGLEHVNISNITIDCPKSFQPNIQLLPDMNIYPSVGTSNTYETLTGMDLSLVGNSQQDFQKDGLPISKSNPGKLEYRYKCNDSILSSPYTYPTGQTPYIYYRLVSTESSSISYGYQSVENDLSIYDILINNSAKLPLYTSAFNNGNLSKQSEITLYIYVGYPGADNLTEAEALREVYKKLYTNNESFSGPLSENGIETMSTDVDIYKAHSKTQSILLNIWYTYKSTATGTPTFSNLKINLTAGSAPLYASGDWSAILPS